MTRTATNPDTGERVALIDGAWVPIQGTATHQDTGDQLYKIDGRWMPAEEQRVSSVVQTNPMVERARAAGYTDEQISEMINPPDVVKMPGVGELDSSIILGMGRRGKQGQLALQQLFGADVDDELADMQRADERGGLADRKGAMVGGMAPYLPLMMLNPTTAAGAVGMGLAEGAAEAATQPVYGEDENFWLEKFKQFGKEATIGAGLPIAADVGGRIATNLRNAPATVGDTLTRPSTGRGRIARMEGDELADRTGISLSEYERGQNEGAGLMETVAAESLWNRNQAQAIREVKAKEFETFIDRFIDEQGISQLPRKDVAVKVQQAVEEYGKDLYTARRAQANSDYDVVRSWEDGRPMIDAGNYRTELERISAEGRAAGATEDQIKVGNVADDRLNRLEEQYGYLTGRDVEQISRSGSSGGSVWDASNRTYEDVLNARLRGAIDEDLAGYPDLQEAIANARSNYKANSQAIESIENIGLGKIVGEDLASDITGVSQRSVSPHQVMDKLWGESPEAFAETFQVLDKIRPEVANELRVAYIMRAVEASKIAPASKGLGGDIDFVGFLQALGVSGGAKGRALNDEKIKAMFAGTEFEQFGDDLVNVSRRLADSKFKNFSGTDVRAETRELVNDALGVAAAAGGAGFDWSKILKLPLKPVGNKALLNRVDPNSPNYLGQGVRPQISIPVEYRNMLTPAALGFPQGEDE